MLLISKDKILLSKLYYSDISEIIMDPPLDLNLTALISSVERDILLLEQLETQSNKNPETNDLPFPFNEEAFTLQRVGKSSGDY